MRHLLGLLVALMTIPAFSQSMKMVVDAAGNVAGRYVRTNADTYTIGVQDIYDVPKSGNKVVVFRAEKGQGVIFCKHLGEVAVYGAPSRDGEIIGRLVYEDGYVPEIYECKGKKSGWYKVKINDRLGFVSADSVLWDGMSTF